MTDNVLVLNQNFEPLNVCSWRRAFVLVALTKAEVIDFSRHPIHTAVATYPRPSVIRLMHQVRRPRSVVKLTRREVFLRDNFMCQYCGQRSRDLTVDHVMPKHRGGRHTWDNLVSACKACNHRKGGHTPEEAHMRLLNVAKRILKRAGFPVIFVQKMGIETNSHQCGTLRFGGDPKESVLDEYCRTHDFSNLFVVDSSFFPSSSAVNPALTIAAQALRVGNYI